MKAAASALVSKFCFHRAITGIKLSHYVFMKYEGTLLLYYVCKMADGELCYIEDGEKLENAWVRHERRMENSQSDKGQRN